MKLRDIADRLELKVRTTADRLDAEVTRGYASDLLSDVLANGRKNDVWITLQIHPNIVAVASMKELAGIMIINGREPAAETLAKANEENIPLLVSRLPAFELIGRLYGLGIGGIWNSANGA